MWYKGWQKYDDYDDEDTDDNDDDDVDDDENDDNDNDDHDADHDLEKKIRFFFAIFLNIRRGCELKDYKCLA